MPALSPTLRVFSATATGTLARRPCCRAFSASSSRLRPPNDRDRDREDGHPPPLLASENPPPPPSFSSPPRITHSLTGPPPSNFRAGRSPDLSARLDQALGASSRTTPVGGGVSRGSGSGNWSAGAGSGGEGLPDEYAQELYNSQNKFMPGDVYAPNDLTLEELNARRSNRKPVKDAFDVLGINPLTQYTNYSLLSEYVTSMGRILHSRNTGLRPVNQRRIAKAIRRAVGIGFLPSTHRHPEVLKTEEMFLNSRLGRPTRRM